MPILDVTDLRVHFHTRHGLVKAVDGVSFQIERGDVLGIVGESGSGKSVSCLALMGLLPSPPARIESGRAVLGPGAGDRSVADVLALDAEGLRRLRGRRIGMIFQEPMTSLNPYLRIGTQLMEVLTTHEASSESLARKRATEMLDLVGIPEPSIRMDQYPHEFSGGMRQRVMIAMALLARPDLLIADEPTTALDVTIQAQILELLKQLQKQFGMSIILISHAMGVVAEMSEQILVMYAGRIVERGRPADLFGKAAHPYTRALIESMPVPSATRRRLQSIPGAPPDMADLPVGCVFAPRCSFVQPICRDVYPDERATPEQPSHTFRCHVDINK